MSRSGGGRTYSRSTSEPSSAIDPNIRSAIGRATCDHFKICMKYNKARSTPNGGLDVVLGIVRDGRA